VSPLSRAGRPVAVPAPSRRRSGTARFGKCPGL
jgi:hypothetical protein